jgi:dTDP-4-dehydrorhamnose reductase
VNAAAYTAVDQAETEPEVAFAVNAEGAGEVAFEAREVGAPVIQISTDYVFDGRATQPYREDSATGPVNVYGQSKLAGEEAVRSANPQHLIFRTSWVFSPFGANFLKTMLRVASERDEVRVVSDQIGCPTSAHGLARAILEPLRAWRSGRTTGQGDTYHFASAGACSWSGFAEEIFRASSEAGGPAAQVVPITTDEYPTIAKRPGYSVLDTSKFTRDFNLALPNWQNEVREAVRRLVSPQ